MSNAFAKSLLVFASLLLTSTNGFAADPPRPRIGPSVASDLPEYYPSRFDRTGVLQEFDRRHNRLVINATAYGYGSGLRVHTLRAASVSVHSLKVGSDLGFTFELNRRGQRIITQIWVLPKGYVRGS